MDAGFELEFEQMHLSISACFCNESRCVSGANITPKSMARPNTRSDVKLSVENSLICSWTDRLQTPGSDGRETRRYSSPEEGDAHGDTVRQRGLQEDIRFCDVDPPEDSQELEAAVLVVGILVGFLGFVVGIIVIVMSKMEPLAV